MNVPVEKAPKQIVIVEDEVIISEDMKNRLNRMGYNVAGIFVKGDEAIEFIEKSIPDLILMDIQIKGDIDGIETAEIIKRKYDIPIIFLTSYADEKTIERAKLTEPSGYVVKPYDDVDIYTSVQIALHKYEVEKKVKENERWFATTLKSIGDAVIATDEEGKIKFMNTVAEQWTGWKESEAANKKVSSVLNIVSEENLGFQEFPVEMVIKTGKPVIIENHHILISRKGERRFIKDNASPIYDDNKKLIGVVLICQDITRRELAEKELIAAKESAERSDALKSEFLAQVSHEIRTPLNNILSFSSLLRDEFEEMLPDGLESAFKIINSSAKRLIKTIELILNLSRIQTGNFDLKPEEIDLHEEILDNLVLEFYTRAKEKNLYLNYKNKAQFTRIKGDRYTIEQIFINLIDNAIKYTKRGTVSIVLYNEDNKIIASVLDSGIGISAKNINEVFKPFFQENIDHAKNSEGTGLGLALVKEYAEINNAGVEVFSEKKIGTEFKVIFKKI